MSSLRMEDGLRDNLFQTLFHTDFQEMCVQLRDGCTVANKLLLSFICEHTLDEELDVLILPDVSLSSFRTFLEGLEFRRPLSNLPSTELWNSELGFWIKSEIRTSLGRGINQEDDISRRRTGCEDVNIAWDIISKNININLLPVEVDSQLLHQKSINRKGMENKADFKHSRQPNYEFNYLHDSSGKADDSTDWQPDESILPSTKNTRLESIAERITLTHTPQSLQPNQVDSVHSIVLNALDTDNEDAELPDTANPLRTDDAHRKKEVTQSVNFIENKCNKYIQDLKISQCSICGKILADKHSLKRHETAVHSRRQDFECKVCKKRFALMNNLTEHVNSVHATQKKWICDLCGQRLNSKKSMETHKLVHQEGSKNLKCSECPQLFRHRNTLKKHEERIHQFTANNRIQCAVCYKFLNHAEGLKRHMKKMHSTVLNFPCDFCDAKFAFNYDLNKHKKKHSVNGDANKSTSENDVQKAVKDNNELTYTMTSAGELAVLLDTSDLQTSFVNMTPTVQLLPFYSSAVQNSTDQTSLVDILSVDKNQPDLGTLTLMSTNEEFSGNYENNAALPLAEEHDTNSMAYQKSTNSILGK